MVTLQKMVWDIRRILKSTNDDTEIKDLHLIEKINHYRSIMIEKQHSTQLLINPEWVQSFRAEPLTQVNSGDLSFAINTDLKFGKIVIPSMLFNDKGQFGLVRVSTTSGWNQMHLIDKDALQLMISVSDWRLQTWVYYFVLGNGIYVYNFFGKVNIDTILGDPREGYIYNTTYVASGDIVADQMYTVMRAPVYYNSGRYPLGATVTGIAGITTYTGAGKLVKYPFKRKLSYTDQYPVDDGMAQEIIWMILTKDYQIERTVEDDNLNDASDEFKMKTRQ